MALHYLQDPRAVQRLHEGPLGPYIDAFAAELRAEGYAPQSAEVKLRLVADFSRWLAKQRLLPAEITLHHLSSYLRSRTRHRRPRLDDRAISIALQSSGSVQPVLSAVPARPAVADFSVGHDG